jgi:hypothetical protein
MRGGSTGAGPSKSGASEGWGRERASLSRGFLALQRKPTVRCDASVASFPLRNTVSATASSVPGTAVWICGILTRLVSAVLRKSPPSAQRRGSHLFIGHPDEFAVELPVASDKADFNKGFRRRWT